MPQLSRSQLVAYGAIAVALLLIGTRWIQSRDSASGSGPTGVKTAQPFHASGGPGGQDVVVDVTGAVQRPGVYRLPTGSRVTDAVERAGGATGKANAEGINLAARLSDGQQVVVPARTPAATAAAGGSSATAPETPISLGSATVEQLDTIEGIGPITAQKIVEYRDSHGGLSSVDQLDRLSGIGPATLESLKARLQP